MIKVFKDVKNFTIDRKKWHRGKGADGSSLLTKNNKQCCLGFYGEACGIPKKHLVNSNVSIESTSIKNHFLASPACISDAYKGYFWDSFLINKDNGIHNSDDCEELMNINDDASLSDSEREKRLTEIFNEHGIKVTFIN